jgi:heparanase 1
MNSRYPVAVLALSFASASLLCQTNTIDAGKLAKLGTVSSRFQGYNIEMVEVTGGRFWAPYKDIGKAQKDDA